ncbi:MAG: alpha/beta hydrolase fold domain-containing protein [Anaerolineales bacterium]
MLIFVFAALTLIKPRSGWGRLALFIPKLFSGSFIVAIAALGVLVAAIGWLAGMDAVSIGLGLGAFLIAARHIYRIVSRSHTLAWELSAIGPDKLHPGMLPSPWTGIWRVSEDCGWQQDVPIGTHPETGDVILADLWQPADPADRSGMGIIYLHGSGWHYADKDFGTRHYFRQLARQGHVIADLAYTLAPKADLFGMIADVKRAIGWMKGHAEELGIDPERIILMGGSAGGHLALLAGYTPNHPQFDPPNVTSDTSVCGVVSYYGPPDLVAQYDRFDELPGLTGRSKLERAFMTALERRFGFETIPVHRLLPEFMGGTPSQIPELYAIGSVPTHIGPQCPPTLLLQGTHDFSGAAPEVKTLYSALRHAGQRAFLLELPDTEHGFDLYKPRWSPAAQAATYLTERFLAALQTGLG